MAGSRASREVGLLARSLSIAAEDGVDHLTSNAMGLFTLLASALVTASSCVPAATVPAVPNETPASQPAPSSIPSISATPQPPSPSPRSTRTPTATATPIPIGTPPGDLVFQSGDSVVYLPAKGEPHTVYSAVEGPPPGSPSLSPDCQWVALTAPQADSTGFQGDILAVWIDGTEVRSIASSSRHESGPSWSADGRRLVFVYDGSELHIVELDSGARARLIAVDGGSVFAPAWSPTDEAIAYIEETQDGLKIRMVHPNHTPLPDVATGSVTPSGGLSWSPDGRRLAFVGDDGDLYISDIASGTATQALTMPGRIEGTTWAADGKTIVFSATREENPTQYLWDLYSVNLADGELRQLTTSGQDRSPGLCRVTPP